MKLNYENYKIRKWIIIILIFIISLFFIIILPLELNFADLPGDLGDSRFNNYILEHNYRWLTGKEDSLFTAPFAYPHSFTLTFSDNHFGSMFFYSLLRWLSFDRETAFQGWYLLSFLLNFSASAYVFHKLNLRPLASGFGAFLFTFGLPVLARTVHAQFSFRFCVPLSSYALWKFSRKPSLRQILILLGLIVWQFYISIYTGFFLSLLLLMLMLVILLCNGGSNIRDKLMFFPNLLVKAWKDSNKYSNLVYLLLILLITVSLIWLFLPYVYASNYYGFSRSWEEVSVMLPRIQSYFLSDQSLIWSSLSSKLGNVQEFRWEHQLFIGLPAIFIILTGLIWRFETPHKKMAFSFIISAGILILLTLFIDGFSLYRIIWNLPGVHSIRAVTRIILVLLWPFALFASIVIDSLIKLTQRHRYLNLVIVLLIGLTFSESVFFNHLTYSKAYAQSRITSLYERVPSDLPEDPILFVWNPKNIFWGLTELDAMILAQDLGWPVLNGYSGNLPVGYGPTKDCDQASIRVIRYLDFINSHNIDQYNQLLSRVVTIGPQDCILNFDIQNLGVTYFEGPFPEELISEISLEIDSTSKKGDYLYVDIIVKNDSKHTLPAESSTNNPFKVSWRFREPGEDFSTEGFDTRKNLISDVEPGHFAEMTIITPVPKTEGVYRIEISAVQENKFWFHDKGLIPAISSSTIKVDSDANWSIQ